jgi:hypothetical protein
MRAAYELVHVNLIRNFERSKRRFDIRVRVCRFKVGEQVWFYSPRKYRHLSPKWTLQRTGPYEIIRKLNDVNCTYSDNLGNGVVLQCTLIDYGHTDFL